MMYWTRNPLAQAQQPWLLFLTLFLACAVSAWTPSTAPADEALPYPPEYVQGEYSGSMLVDGVWRPYGLQVIARGDGRFTANLLPGGLPDTERLAPYPTPLEGQFDGERLVLQSAGGVRLEFQPQPVYRFVQWSQPGRESASLNRVQRYSSTLGLAPPPNAIPLFRNGQIQGLANAKLTPDGNLAVGATTDFPVGDFRLHVEFRLPLQASKSNQDRGNSGIYMQRRYEIQILDSFGEQPVENNAGSIYRQRAPRANMSLPPLAWQTYDIWFQAAKWDDAGNKTDNARVTVLHNGVAIHDQVEITAKTGAGWKETPEPQPILFQDHSDPVEFRNVWLVKGTP